MLRIEPLHPVFAARVTGINVRDGVPASIFADLREAFERFSVLVFPGQDVDDDAQIAFSEGFGPLERTRAGANGAGGKVIVLSNLDNEGRIVAPTDRQVLNNRANQIWHHDSSFKPVPARASMLSARQIPSAGGDTEFANTRAGWAAMPPDIRAALHGGVAVHDFGWSRSRIDPALVTAAERDDWPPVRQPTVLDGSLYGASLYLGAHARSIEGVGEADGRSLIDGAMRFVTQPRFVYSHRWAPHDLVLWDNHAVLHRATPFQSAGERRHMVRTTIAGNGPLLR